MNEKYDELLVKIKQIEEDREFKKSPNVADWICNRYPGYPYLNIDINTNQLCCKERPNTLDELKKYAREHKINCRR